MLPGTTLQMHLFRPRLIPTIESLPKTQTHREVDLEVVAANKEGYVRTYVILSSMTYGIANTIGLTWHSESVLQIPGLVPARLDRNQGGVA